MYKVPHKWVVFKRAEAINQKGKNAPSKKNTIWRCKNCKSITIAWNGIPPTNHNYWENHFSGYRYEFIAEEKQAYLFPIQVSWDCKEEQVREILEL